MSLSVLALSLAFLSAWIPGITDRDHSDRESPHCAAVHSSDALCLCSHWFHYIVSTGVSIQCNSRSGQALRGRRALAYCGNTSFYDPEELHAESSLLL